MSILKTLLLVIMISMAAACASSSEPKQAPTAKQYSNYPAWVNDPFVEGDKIAAIGSAKIGPSGLQFARTEALANGRDELARMISVKVKNMIKNFTEQTGVGDSMTADKVVTNVSKQLANEVLSGSRQKNMWVSDTNEVFIHVIIDEAVVKQAAKETAVSSYKREEAMWQKFLAQNAQSELDKSIEEEFGK